MNDTILTPVGERLLQILTESKSWMNRSQLSAAYGRTLGMTDFSALEDLEDYGLIEINKKPIGQTKTMYEYRIK